MVGAGVLLRVWDHHRPVVVVDVVLQEWGPMQDGMRWWAGGKAHQLREGACSAARIVIFSSQQASRRTSKTIRVPAAHL